MKKLIADVAGNPAGRRSAILLAALGLVAVGLVGLKVAAAQDAATMAAAQLEPAEAVTTAVAIEREHRSSTTAIGTVLATRSVSLRNEVAGTVATVRLEPGEIVERGQVLVALDVAVERAELQALEARAELARATLARYERMAERQAASALELDNVRAERDIALADVARLRAVIERKTIRAPFRARVGIADVHPGQFLDAGTLLTTLQGVDDAVHIDFSVAQSAAAGLSAGDEVEVRIGDADAAPTRARVTAIDARVDPDTRNAIVRARIEDADPRLTPGASTRVRVPTGESRPAVFLPVSAVRRGPGGDHVFVVEDQGDGTVRARVRQVRIGAVVGDEVVVLTGVSAGERVAATGSFKLRDGVLVQPADGPAQDGPEAPGAGSEPISGSREG